MKAKESIIDYLRSMEKLVKTIQELSLADDLEKIMVIVKNAACELSLADGVFFVLREGDNCRFYRSENTINFLAKGNKIPLSNCISGVSISNRSYIFVEDIHQDERVKGDFYKNTFIKSLLVVPIKVTNPIGTIECYWTNKHKPTIEQIKLTQALADITAITIENIQVYSILENLVEKRTKELESANQELEIANKNLATAYQGLEAFSYTLSHDLKEPLNIISGFSRLILEKSGASLDEKTTNYVTRIYNSSERMNLQIEAILSLHKLSETKIKEELSDLSEMSNEIISMMKENDPDRQVQVLIEKELIVKGDKALLYLVMQNLLSNAWKYSSKVLEAKIKVGSIFLTEKERAFFVEDNGVGFDQSKANNLFSPFQRMHSQKDFPGTGIGLASVQQIITRHNGKVWLESSLNKGTKVYFIIPNI